MSSIFDLLGILTLCVFQPKCVVQQLCKQGIYWDKPIPNRLLKQEDMQFIFDLNIPHWFGFEKQLGDRIEDNIFCDTSSEAYGYVLRNIFLVFYYQYPALLLSKENP